MNAPVLTVSFAQIYEDLDIAANNAWSNVLRTDPCARVQAEDAIATAYRENNLPLPAEFIWLNGPHEYYSKSGSAVPFLEVDGPKHAKTVIDKIWYAPRAQAWKAIKNAIPDHDQIGIPHGLQPPVYRRFRNSFRFSNSSIRSLSASCGWGNQDAPWLAQYRLLREKYAMNTIPEFQGLNELVKFGGWFAPKDNVCFMFERPDRLAIDERGDLHFAADAALRWGDSLCGYFLHGIDVGSRTILKPQRLNLHYICRSTDTSIRWAQIQIFGALRFINEVGAKAINSDSYGTLYRVDLPNPFQILRMPNSTSKSDAGKTEQFRCVPLELKTAKDAFAWVSVRSPEKYGLSADAFEV